MSFGRNLKSIMYREGINVAGLVKVSGVSQGTINYIFRDMHSPRFDTVICLLAAMGYKLYLVAPDGEERKYSTISKWIRFIMSHFNDDATKFAERTGLHAVTIRIYLRNAQYPNLKILEKILDACGYKVEIRKGDIVYNLYEDIDIWRTVV